MKHIRKFKESMEEEEFQPEETRMEDHFSGLHYSKKDLFKVWKYLSEQGWASDEEESRDSFEEWFSKNF
jgi:hypothetical protein